MTPKLYQGIRGPLGARVFVNGKPLPHVVLHSPTGIEWGYGGSGPADLALSLLADHLGETPTRSQLEHGLSVAWALHQHFKAEVVARWPHEGFELTHLQIERFLKQYRSVADAARERIAEYKRIEELDALAQESEAAS